MFEKFSRRNVPRKAWKSPGPLPVTGEVPYTEIVRGSRMVTMASRGHNSWVVRDPNDGKSKPVESQPEFNTMLTGIADPDVVSIEAQARSFEHPDGDGVFHTHTLDFVFTMRTGLRAGQVVKEKRRADVQNYDQFVEHLLEWVPADLADCLDLVNPHDLPAWFTANARLIHSARLDRDQSLDAPALEFALTDRRPRPVSEFVVKLGPQAFRSVARLIFARKLRMNPDNQMIAPDTLVELVVEAA